MSTTSPEAAVRAFFGAMNRGDIDAAVSSYEPRAVLVPQPGRVAEGTTALRAALNGFLALKPTLTLEQIEVVAADDLALSIARWTLVGTGPDGEPMQMEGTTSDVLRRQADGRWLFVIDNPWGAGILG